MALEPDRAIALDVHQVPGRERQRVELLQVRSARIDDHLTAALERQSEDRLRLDRLAEQVIDQLAQGLLTFADQHIVRACLEVRLRVVGRVRTGGDHRAAVLTRHADHRERCLAHA